MSKMWAEVNALMGQAVGGLQADLDLVNDPQYAGLPVEKLVELVSGESAAAVIFVADKETILNPEHPILVVDVAGEPGRHFRANPSQIQSIENNLSIANMDWEDFAQSLDDDGVFRGFAV